MIAGRRCSLVRDQAGRLLFDFESSNLLTAQGKLSLLNQGLIGKPQVPLWYSGLITEDRHVADAVTNGSTTLTSATANFVQVHDAGRQLTVYGAGTSGAQGHDLVTTILTVLNPTTILMAGVASDAAPGHLASIGPLLSVGDTYQNHPGWTEIRPTLITNRVRPTWKNPQAALSGSSAIVLSTGFAPPFYEIAPAISGQVFVHGFFLASLAALEDNGPTGVLFSEGEYAVGALNLGPGFTITDAYGFTLA